MVTYFGIANKFLGDLNTNLCFWKNLKYFVKTRVLGLSNICFTKENAMKRRTFFEKQELNWKHEPFTKLWTIVSKCEHFFEILKHFIEFANNCWKQEYFLEFANKFCNRPRRPDYTTCHSTTLPLVIFKSRKCIRVNYCIDGRKPAFVYHAYMYMHAHTPVIKKHGFSNMIKIN